MSAGTRTQVRTTRVMIVDDHPIVRYGLSKLIAAEPDLEVCCQANNVTEGLDLVEKTHPDLAIVDISLEDGGGFELIHELHTRHPRVKILASSIHDETLYAVRALKAGASGYVEKRESIGKILDAVHQILEGAIYLSPKMANHLLRCAATGEPLSQEPIAVLSSRELEVFEMIGHGITVQQIGHRLGVSPKTVESHRRKIKEKLNLQNSLQLSRCAFEWVRSQA
ncbi:MAG: response regulator transcription factor [Pirellulales bacterium]|nr:response regulator transcription factor [Pirellulales bacterium]